MALDKNSNGYTFGFAIIMVSVVGAILASLAMGLKPMQEKNAANKKRMEILSAVGIEATRENADELFKTYITKQLALDYNGNPVEGVSAFDIDVKKDYKDKTKGEKDKNYPLFVSEVEGETKYVIPMIGTGLWGPIWGFVALEDDYKTIFGANFNHASETPGLGAEISSEKLFQRQFKGKKIKDEDDNFISIKVMKGGANKSSLNEVDGITGGTITSNGVGEMLDRSFVIYNNYFNKLASQTASLSDEIEIVENIITNQPLTTN